MKFLNFDDKELCYFFNRLNNLSPEIEKAIVTTESHPFLCALGSLDAARQQNLVLGNMTLSSLELFAVKVSVFFVRVYDGESYMMWKR